jgi:DNA-binding response OmpR family regulator
MLPPAGKGSRANPGPATREAVVVEDDPDIARLLKFILEREAFAVTLCEDGRAATTRLASNAVASLVVLDVMLPYVNGYELLGLIRKSAAWAGVPVLMLTAKSQEADIVRALDAGANDYVTKPFQPAELKARIRRLVPSA